MSKQQLKYQIDAIINKRKEDRLPRIEASISFLNSLLEKLDELDRIITEISRQKVEGKGPYYVMLTKDKGMESRLEMVKTREVRYKITSLLEKLTLLKKRFSRAAVQIAFVGYSKQGKSKFLQSISGLGEKIIPAYSGTSCTGAISCIHNFDCPFHAEVTFFSQEEFLKLINDKLEKFVPGRTFSINTIHDLKNANINLWPGNINLAYQYNKFVETYIYHIDEIWPLIGAPTLHISDEKQVFQYLSQYEFFDSIPEGENPALFVARKHGAEVIEWRRYYHKYAAVKSVNIYTSFPSIGDAKIVLVDTVGIGSSAYNDVIEDEMFRVLREECYAAVIIYRPDICGGISINQYDFLRAINDKLLTRKPQKWIYYVVNKVTAGAHNNLHVIDEVLKQVSMVVKNMTSVPVAGVVAVDGSDPEEVYERLMTPLLDMVTKNLDDIDESLVNDANYAAMELYMAYSDLCNSVSQVFSGKSKLDQEEGTLLHHLMKGPTYRNSLCHLDEEVYVKNKNLPCKEVSEKIDEIIDYLPDLVPDPEYIFVDVDRGTPIPIIFMKYADILRNEIISKFEEVNTEALVPLQEEVKEAIIEILFKDAQFGKIPLLSYSIEDGPSKAWLEALIKEKIPSEKYPNLQKAMSFVLDYQLNLEGMIEYNVAKCLDAIDPLVCEPVSPKPGLSLEGRAYYICQELLKRLTSIQYLLRQWRDEFAMIPSHSFYARVRKFREKMTSDENVQDEILEFYRANRLAIWSEEFANISDMDKAFEDWNKKSKQLLESCKMKYFTIKI